MIKGYPEYRQNDNNEWSNIVYHKYKCLNDSEKDTIANTGCGPTSLAIVIGGLLKDKKVISEVHQILIEDVEEYNKGLDEDYKIDLCINEEIALTPDQLVAMATLTMSKEDGIGVGSYDEVFENIVDRYFYDYLDVIEVDNVKMVDALDNWPIIAHSSAVNRGTDKQERSMFASSGHYITIVGKEIIDGELYLIINDPYTEEVINAHMKKGDYIGEGKFKYDAIIDPIVGCCDRFWEVRLKNGHKDNE